MILGRQDEQNEDKEEDNNQTCQREVATRHGKVRDEDSNDQQMKATN